MIIQIDSFRTLDTDAKDIIYEDSAFPVKIKVIAVEIDEKTEPVFGDLVVVIKSNKVQDVRICDNKILIDMEEKSFFPPLSIGYYKDKSERFIYISGRSFPIDELTDILPGRKMCNVICLWKMEKLEKKESRRGDE